MPSKSGRRASGSRRLPWPAVVVVAAVALLGAITLVQWVVAAFAGLIKVILLVVVVAALATWIVAAKARR